MIDPSKIDIGITPRALLGIAATLVIAGMIVGAGIAVLVWSPP